ncbi:hypothetical protein [Nocardioides yefusunii]|uniref:Uncharacterized protein n=1 Tax=Nocardioides yefusunii TaxID=2500546 RepID=A0ABW1QSY9_9ACTN|nr:hypothetical protein [Nocardioides yefusunii]
MLGLVLGVEPVQVGRVDVDHQLDVLRRIHRELIPSDQGVTLPDSGVGVIQVAGDQVLDEFVARISQHDGLAAFQETAPVTIAPTRHSPVSAPDT